MRFVDDPLDDLKSGKSKLWMLLVGVNQYQDNQLTCLNFAVSDCQGLAEALKEATHEFRSKEVVIHCDSSGQTSTLEAVRTSLRRIKDEANSQDTVLFYFSGHGIVEPASKQPFLCLAQTQTDNLPNTGLGLQELLQVLKRCGNKQLVLLDACHSGSIVHLWGGARGEAEETQPNPTRELAEVLQQYAAQSRGFCALLSCDEGQRSWEFPDLKHGVFTYYLMQGLQGKAIDQRGIIEANGLYKYVYNETQQYVDSRMRQLHLPNPHNYQQTPRVIMSMAGDLVLGLRSEAVDLTQDYEKRLQEYREKFNRAIQREYPLSQDTCQQLQKWQQEMGLRDEDINATQERIIAVYEHKLQQYQQKIDALVDQEYPLNQDTCQQLQQSLGLKEEVTAAIKAKVTQAYEQKLQQYEEAIAAAIDREYPLGSDTYQQLQQSYCLRNEIIQPIAAKVTQAYEQKLQQYEEAIAAAIDREYPLGSDTYQQLQQSYCLRNEITQPIAAKVTQAYEQKLQQYEQALIKAIQRQYPLSDDDCEFLDNLRRLLNLNKNQIIQRYEKKLQQYEQAFSIAIHQHPISDNCQQLQHIGLREEITAVIEAQVTQVYKQKLQQYEQAWKVAIERQYPLSDGDRQQLHQLQQNLGLGDRISNEISAQVAQAYEQKLQIEAEYQRKLHRYEKVFTEAIQRQLFSDSKCEVIEPLSNDEREILEDYRQFLDLSKEITQFIEAQVTQAYKQKLQHYEQSFINAIQRQYPLGEQAQRQLQQLQQSYCLSNEITQSIAAKVTQAYEPKLKQYEQAFTSIIHEHYPLSDEVRQPLQLLQQNLGLKEEIIAAIEAQVTQAYEQKLQQYEQAFIRTITQHYRR